MYTILPASRYIVFHTVQKLFMSRGSFDFCGKEKRKQCAVNIFFISKVFLALHMREDNIKIINIRTDLKTTEWQCANWIEEAQYGA